MEKLRKYKLAYQLERHLKNLHSYQNVQQIRKKITLSTLNLTSFKHIPLEISLILAAVHISKQRENNHLP